MVQLSPLEFLYRSRMSEHANPETATRAILAIAHLQSNVPMAWAILTAVEQLRILPPKLRSLGAFRGIRRVVERVVTERVLPVGVHGEQAQTQGSR